ncbi:MULTISPECIES: NAD(P)H-dependent oxidoreductase [Cobetia]|uniref:NADPH-dependent FMN reductase n=1 Tax=Cobetia TaxID=204286 RepID=UPI001C2E96A0|nr:MULTISPECIES: NAD(P)H-dependent oxidoreductase [Cobetia]MDI4661240.1 NAD(P)H-dependent oxidoreductase [Cobetia sp. BMC6]
MALKILVFLGSVRTSTPPAPARLGERVARCCVALLEESGHEAVLIDPLDYALADPFKPLFSYAQRNAPPDLLNLAQQIEAADGYVMVSPEYNHSMSPALANLLNHFGSSLYSYKPSVIATYSAGQWGGVRAAVNMRTFLSELGCLPVSAMIHVPRAQEVLNEDGGYASNQDGREWDVYLGRAFEQLAWWANAARRYHECEDGEKRPGAFTRSPSQRNAP